MQDMQSLIRQVKDASAQNNEKPVSGDERKCSGAFPKKLKNLDESNPADDVPEICHHIQL